MNTFFREVLLLFIVVELVINIVVLGGLIYIINTSTSIIEFLNSVEDVNIVAYEGIKGAAHTTYVFITVAPFRLWRPPSWFLYMIMARVPEA